MARLCFETDRTDRLIEGSDGSKMTCDLFIGCMTGDVRPWVLIKVIWDLSCPLSSMPMHFLVIIIIKVHNLYVITV